MRHRHMSNDTTDKPMNFGILRKLIPYLLEHRQRVLLALLCLILAKVASVSLPFVLKHIVDALDSGDRSIILAPIGLLLAYGLVRFSNVLFGELRDTLFGRVTERAMRRLGLTVFQHLHQLDLAFHLNRNTGGLARDIERGITGISFLMRFMVFNIVPTFLEIGLVALLLLINYDASYAIVTLLSVVAYVAYSVVATDWRTRYVRAANVADSQSNTRAIDSLMNYETVKYFNNEQYEAAQYDQDLEQWENARRKNRLTLFALNGGQSLIIAIAMTLMMVMAANDVVNGSMTLGDFVLINAFMMQLFMPLNFLGFVYREMKGSLANIEQLFSLLEQPTSIADKSDAQPLVAAHGELQFENVHFSYHPEREVINNLSFKLEVGEKVAIVGGSGSGKSTLVKLLFRFYDPTQGRITLDGVDLKDLQLDALRRSIAIVPQDTVLFNQTLFENVRYGRIDASDEEVREAIRLAHLQAFIESLPDGENTKVGERGLKLSGGEKQRVAIARAILKRAPILVFDEATSSLDSHSERAVLDAIQTVSKNHTSLVIAHRLSTIVDADRILVMDQGKLIEQGSHQQLLEQQGSYAKLWHVQQKSDRSESASETLDTTSASKD